ncbi:zinc ABC transporter substrate-binding protein [Pseudogemmobacter faecipullorum]|uniref:High-affinity zinc uptake system protein ZnuA n=1 Tax=Pseudogemmobacter faecipullorum TaxID=2755041 RepID=A0ABS8CPP6_9RHOB|nr:zinc ABC transporter substrate-binding protein [Pseudogemmobacter faecipullorum]MCB5411163.1 zinc ABC transporter substrate-binding protein [Pseudogemmobacter faecipullorum]
MRYIISLTLTSSLALTTSMAMAAPPQIVTDVPVVHSLVSMVTGDLTQPELLLEKGGSEHHFQLRPSQASLIAAADLVVQIGPELTPWLNKALALRPAEAPVLQLLHDKGTHRRTYGEAAESEAHNHDHDHDHDAPAGEAEAQHDHDHDHDHDHAGHDHGPGSTDPHAWLEPGNARHWLGLIAAELARLDPENAATYAANARAGAAEIARADQEAQAKLAPVAAKPFATFHDAYGYYTAHYRLNFAGSIAMGDAGTPGARHLSALRARVQAGEILCLFPEVGHDRAPLERVAEATGVQIGGLLDPVGTGMEPGAALYPTLLTRTADTLAECLSR